MADGGRVVALSGPDSRFAVSDHGLIGAAKAALESLVRNLAVEVGRRGVTVNAVVPGVTRTDSLAFGLEQGVSPAQQMLLDNIPLGRFAEPEEIAAVVAFLCSRRRLRHRRHVRRGRRIGHRWRAMGRLQQQSLASSGQR